MKLGTADWIRMGILVGYCLPDILCLPLDETIVEKYKDLEQRMNQLEGKIDDVIQSLEQSTNKRDHQRFIPHSFESFGSLMHGLNSTRYRLMDYRYLSDTKEYGRLSAPERLESLDEKTREQPASGTKNPRRKRSRRSSEKKFTAFVYLLWNLFGMIKDNRDKINSVNSMLESNQKDVESKMQDITQHLETLEKRTNFTNCEAIAKDLNATLIRISKDQLEDRERTANQLDKWATAFIVCPFPLHDRYGRQNDALLHILAKLNASQMAGIVIWKGADLLAKSIDGATALHTAAEYNSTRVLQLLLERGAKVYETDCNNLTPLHYAARNNTKEAAKILLDNKADIHARTYEGNTPLHMAAYHGSVQVLELLVRNYAEVNIQNYKNQTPLHFAGNCVCNECYNILKREGANDEATDRHGDKPVKCSKP